MRDSGRGEADKIGDGSPPQLQWAGALSRTTLQRCLDVTPLDYSTPAFCNENLPDSTTCCSSAAKEAGDGACYPFDPTTFIQPRAIANPPDIRDKPAQPGCSAAQGLRQDPARGTGTWEQWEGRGSNQTLPGVR